jgi:S-formylglutathione hydrolase FrmB
LIAAILGMIAGQLVAGWRPIPKGIAVLGIFGVAYGALTMAFRHPDAIRAWQSLTGSPAN